ncbi:MAG: Fe(3+) ions import ATP-binding protein FbpC [Cyanobacteriota bacterium]
MQSSISFENVWHRYPANSSGAWTVAGLDLAMAPGELLGLLGPSGSGKTTLLRLIAGFERPNRGRIVIHGRDVAGPRHWLPAERRGVGMVFQDYALFPHLNAWKNACFGLKRGQGSDRVRWLLELLGLAGMEGRYPHQLSGGQRQRLALVRALAPEPAVLLLDEPFSNLDVEVRLRLRRELPDLLKRCNTSGILVTHDPEEALAICDRVAVLEGGRLHQCDTPQTLVERPASAFVSRFVLQANRLPATCQGSQLLTPFGVMQAAPQPSHGCSSWGESAPSTQGAAASQAAANQEAMVMSDAIHLDADPCGDARVVGREFLGQGWLLQVECHGQELRVRVPLANPLRIDQRCRARLVPGALAQVFPDGRAFQAL